MKYMDASKYLFCVTFRNFKFKSLVVCKKGLKLALNKRQMQVEMGFQHKINKYVNLLLIKEK